MEDGLNGIIGKQFSGSLSPFKVEVDVIDGVIEGEADQIVGISDALFQRFVLRRSDDGGKFLRSGQNKGEAIFGVHGEVGQAP